MSRSIISLMTTHAAAGDFIKYNNVLAWNYGGEGGIRTHGPLSRTSVFETDAIDHSATSP